MFDFDGVLVESADLAFQITKRLVSDELTLEQWRNMSNGNVFDDATVQTFSNNDLPLEQNAFFRHHRSGILQLGLAAGMQQLVERFQDRATLSVVSSSPTVAIEEFLELHGLRNAFSEILGGDFERKKTLKISHLLQKHDVPNDRALFITDTLGDIREANAVDVSSIGVTWGAHPRETLVLGNPHAVVDSAEELFDTMDGLWKL